LLDSDCRLPAFLADELEAVSHPGQPGSGAAGRLFWANPTQNRFKRVEKLGERLHLLGRDRRIVALAIVTTLAVGLNLVCWPVTTFLEELRGFTPITSKIGLIDFLVGIAVGRVIVGLLTQITRIIRYLLILLGVSVFVFGVLFFVPMGSFIYLAIFLAGMALSAILPLIITLTGLFTRKCRNAMGVIKTASPSRDCAAVFDVSDG